MPLSHDMKDLMNRKGDSFCPVENGRNNGSMRMRGGVLSFRAYKKAMREKENEDRPVFKVKE